jgi:hypothetical protein
VRAGFVALGSFAALACLGAAILLARWTRTSATAQAMPAHISAPPDIVRLPERAPSGSAEPAAQRHLARGRDYAARLWCHDALGEFERAIALDPAVRSDARVTSDVVHCLVESNHGRAPAVHFLVEKIGSPAAGPLRKLLGDPHISPEVRRAASDALQGLKE